MKTHHALIWIDHHTATVLHVGRDSENSEVIASTHTPDQLHVKAHKLLAADDGNAAPDAAYMAKVIDAVHPQAEVLLAGPADAKHELMKYAEEHEKAFTKRVIKIENMERATTGELTHHARRFFGLTKPRLGPRKAA
jgi:hypothetical protein